VQTKANSSTAHPPHTIKRVLTIIALIVVVLGIAATVLKLYLSQRYEYQENQSLQLMREKSKLDCNVLPIHCAIRDKNFSLLNAIQPNSPQLEAVDGMGRTPLYFSVDYSADKEAVDILLNKGANPNVYNEGGRPILFSALEMKRYEIAKSLLKNGAYADMEVTGASNIVGFYPIYIPLGFCVANNDLECVSLLLDHGADVNRKSAVKSNGTNLSVYEMAMSRSNVSAEIKQLLEGARNKTHAPSGGEQTASKSR